MVPKPAVLPDFLATYPNPTRDMHVHAPKVTLCSFTIETRKAAEPNAESRLQESLDMSTSKESFLCTIMPSVSVTDESTRKLRGPYVGLRMRMN
jgi:hypothetical protein